MLSLHLLDLWDWLADSDLMPHGYCLLWDPALVGLHVGADAVIALSYYSIPAGLFYFVRRRDDLVFPWLFLLFGVFILACGTTHLMEIWTLWRANYAFEGVVKVVTAVASFGTAVALWKLMPAALQLPSPAQLRSANADLARANADLAAANARLEREVAERRRAEAAMARTAAELKRSNEELAKFAYVASHDLQEPLRMVTSFLQLLERRYENQLDESAQQYIGYAVDGAHRMQHLIRDLLDYSRVQTSERRVEPVDLGATVEEVLHDLQARVRETGAEVAVGALPTVEADAGQMRRLFQNLLGNALKFRHPERPPRIAVRAEREGDDWRIAVADNGIGIAPEHRERVFEVFRRLHTRDEYEGTGIGLAVVQKIVERHGGRVWLESEPGEGATFFVTLPAAPGAA